MKAYASTSLNIDHTANQNQAENDLEHLPPSHVIWDRQKTAAIVVAGVYARADDNRIRKHAEAVGRCSETLFLQTITNCVSGEIGHKAMSWKCRERHCPICQSARACKLNREFKAALPDITRRAKADVFLFLTLSVKNCSIDELRATLGKMNEAWQRLVQRKEFRIVKGWIRGTEVTRGRWIDTRTGQEIDKRQFYKVPAQYCHPKDPNISHPHFHAVLLVPRSYFTGERYIKHEKWVELWKDAARLDYEPTGVDIRRVKTAQGGAEEAVKAATYSVKPAELEIDPTWFHKLHEQVSGLRFLATGGVIKEVFSERERQRQQDKQAREAKEADDIAEGKEPEGGKGPVYVFDFNRPEKRFRRNRLKEV